MNPKPTTAKPAQSTAKLIEELDYQSAQCSEVINSHLVRVTIMVEARKGIEAVNKVFTFPPGAIPAGLKDFFEVWLYELMGKRTALLNETILLLVGSSQIVALDDFITDYTAGEIPSMSADDAAALRKLQPKDIITILVNECPLQVQRIN